MPDTPRSPINFPAELTARFRGLAKELHADRAPLLAGLIAAVRDPAIRERIIEHVGRAQAEHEASVRPKRVKAARARWGS